MMIHCAAIREAYKAILADWALNAQDVKEHENQLIHQTAVLASIHLNANVSEENVRNVVGLAH
ncbi:MAG: hypothetical protein WD767_09585 [Alphaproteobacteria bacterium]